MAPRGTTRRNADRESGVFELGVQGRKTGVYLPESNVRDEHGMMPIDGLFSSPKPGATPTQGEIAMELDSASGPGPATLARAPKLPPPRSRSPMKTNLRSPAVRNPHLGRYSSPERGTIMEELEAEPDPTPVRRRLDFGGALTNGTKLNGHKTNGNKAYHDNEDDDEEDLIAHTTDKNDLARTTNGDNSMAMVDVGDDLLPPALDDELDEEDDTDDGRVRSTRRPGPRARAIPTRSKGDQGAKVNGVSAAKDADEEEEEEEEEEVEAPAKRRGRGATAKRSVEEVPEEDEVDDSGPPAKRRSARFSSGNEGDLDEEPGRNSKRRRTETKEARPRGRPPGSKKREVTARESTEPTADSNATKPKRGRKRKSSGVAALSPVLVHRGPPPPKSRGLMSYHREELDGTTTTRSGRHSIKPLAFWRGERVELDDDVATDGKRNFVLPSYRNVIRSAEPESSASSRGRSKTPGARSNKSKGKAIASGKRKFNEEDEDEDLPEPEEWEVDGGVIEGDVCEWLPEHDENPPGPEDEIPLMVDRIAVAAGAVDTREIRDAEFKFAKTLSMPFFGTGIVDLPPGAKKKPKNTRRMHMAFFVFVGKVKVVVHDTEFRISTGGMWFVPRGNFYSIENDGDISARLWFAQACQMPASWELEDDGPPE